MHIDLTELDGALTELKARMAETAEMPGFQGVMSRLQRDVTPALVRWRAQEINNAIDPEDMRSALIRFMVPVILSETAALYGPDVDDRHYEWLNDFFKEFGEEAGRAFSGDTSIVEHRVTAVEEGHA